MQIIGAGFGRTGTLSMKAALEQLGYEKTHHMIEVLMPKDQTQLDYWDAIGRGERPGWDKVFAGYEACVDFPSCVYWQELAEAYPEAKVILTVRDFDSWYRSAITTIYAVSSPPSWMKLFAKPRKMDRMTRNIIWQGKFGGQFEDKAHVRKVWDEHIAAVKAGLPPERLLVFEVKDGWQPLCAFLAKPVPDTPFPRLNDAEQFKKMISIMNRLKWVPWAMAGTAVLVTALLAAFL